MNSKKLSNQETFNIAWNWFIVQKNKFSIGANLDCAYRGENYTQCIIGCCLNDEEYDPTMEGNTIGDLFYFKDKNNWNLPWEKAQVQFLTDLQYCHDSFDGNSNKNLFYDHMKKQLIKLSINYNLRIPDVS